MGFCFHFNFGLVWIFFSFVPLQQCNHKSIFFLVQHLLIFIGKVFQVIWSIVLPETKVGSRTNGKRKISPITWSQRPERHNNSWHWSQIGICLSSHSSRHPSFSCCFDGIVWPHRHATRLQNCSPLDCQSWVVFSSEEDPRRQMTLSMLCYTQCAGFQSDAALERFLNYHAYTFGFVDMLRRVGISHGPGMGDNFLLSQLTSKWHGWIWIAITISSKTESWHFSHPLYGMSNLSENTSPDKLKSKIKMFCS